MTMKLIYCSWCDKPAEHKMRHQGERDNTDACCDEHYALYFGRALLFDGILIEDLPTLASPGTRVGWHRKGRHAGHPDPDDMTLAALVSALSQDAPECSGRRGGRFGVPYCGGNDNGCAMHYPSEYAGAHTDYSVFVR